LCLDKLAIALRKTMGEVLNRHHRFGIEALLQPARHFTVQSRLVLSGLEFQLLAQHAAESYDFNQKVFAELVKDAPLEPQVKNLATPTLIVWGDHDRALNDSGAEILHQLLPNSQVIIVPDMGHLPMLEAPAQTAADYIKFRDSLAQH